MLSIVTDISDREWSGMV